MSVEFETDKERILMSIVQILARKSFNARSGEDPHHIGRVIRKAKVGELVLCTSGLPHKYTLGYMHEWISESEALIRDLTSDTLCRIGNEDFAPLVGLIERVNMLYGKQQVFYDKVKKAFKNTLE